MLSRYQEKLIEKVAKDLYKYRKTNSVQDIYHQLYLLVEKQILNSQNSEDPYYNIERDYNEEI